MEAGQDASGVVLPTSDAELYKHYRFVSASTHCSACCFLSDVVCPTSLPQLLAHRVTAAAQRIVRKYGLRSLDLGTNPIIVDVV